MSPELVIDRTSPHDAALYFYGELPHDGRAAFERHLPDCRPCQEALDELAEIRNALAPIPTFAAAIAVRVGRVHAEARCAAQ